MKLDVDKAVRLVEKFLKDQQDDPAVTVSIEIWPDIKRYGVRVAEVTYLKGNGGSSFMQSDSSCGTVCFYAERLILAYMFSDDFPEDDLKDDEWRLLEALKA